MAIFYPQEKVFSLKRTADAVPTGDLTKLFEEFYCYLLVSGLYLEGRSPNGVQFSLPQISDETFRFSHDSAYAEMLGAKLAKGLQQRYWALSRHPDLHDLELKLLAQLDGIFTGDKGWYHTLSAKAILSVALSRNFSPDMTVVARYVAFTFGQTDDLAPCKLPRLYLSAFGNIHLAAEFEPGTEGNSSYVEVRAPVLRYGSKTSEGEVVTALWSLITAQLYHFVANQNAYLKQPGDILGDTLAQLTFLGGRNDTGVIPVPRYAAMLYLRRVIGMDERKPAEIAVAFYKDFFFGDLSVTKLARSSLLSYVLDLMVDAVGCNGQQNLFTSDEYRDSYYRYLTQSGFREPLKMNRPAFLDYAVEALDAKASDDQAGYDPTSEPTQGETPDQTSTSEDPEDPQTEDGGYDPSTPPPASPVSAEDGGGYDPSSPSSAEDQSGYDPSTPLATDVAPVAPAAPENTMGLLSFDKTGEGINESLYREAVVALNDRLRTDESVSFSADTKSALNDWVNNYLYRTAIAATQAQIKLLNLKSYLKTVSTQG
jgi:hypothetical protein